MNSINMKTKEDLSKLSTDELKQIVIDGHLESTIYLLNQFSVISEINRRIHDAEFHGGDSDIPFLRNLLPSLWGNIERWIMQHVFGHGWNGEKFTFEKLSD